MNDTTLIVTDPIAEPFWRAAADHRFLLQLCTACGKHQFYPRPFCLQCGSWDINWVDACGSGTVYSFTTVRRQISPDFCPPYIVAVVELEEGPRVLTNIVDGACGIGDRVRLVWKDRDAAPPLPLFTPAPREER
jgi:uncharacterized OB-fold protein